MSVTLPTRNGARVRQLRPLDGWRQIHLRLTPPELDLLEDVAKELGVPIAPASRLLIGLGIESRRRSAPPAAIATESPASTEMLLHLLVAVEQVLALIESFLPEGPGAADAALPAAAMSAQRRLASGDSEPYQVAEP